MSRWRPTLAVTAIALVAGCVPGTYYDISDRYIVGMRWFDRGRYDEAIRSCHRLSARWPSR